MAGSQQQSISEETTVWAVLLRDVRIAWLAPGDEVRLGRDYQPELWHYDNVHRYHALLSAGQDSLTIKDMGKENGVFVDGSRLAAHESVNLSAGESIRLASNCWLNIGRSHV
ncbi:FHA domain-containing protein [Arthrobacter bambusae]|nr:FHA domain-containing protein [Arthrobacter bambusae]